MKKFEIGNALDVDKFNLWFNFCESQQIPYVIIKQKTKYSSVVWDYINLKREIDEVLINNGDETKTKFHHVFKKYFNNKSKYEMSNLFLDAKNIPNENAMKFAEEIFDIINSQLNNQL